MRNAVSVTRNCFWVTEEQKKAISRTRVERRWDRCAAQIQSNYRSLRLSHEKTINVFCFSVKRFIIVKHRCCSLSDSWPAGLYWHNDWWTDIRSWQTPCEWAVLWIWEAGRQEAKLYSSADRAQLKHITPCTHVFIRMTSSANIC